MCKKQTKSQTSRLILSNQIAGFSVVLLLIWLSEVPDLPALLFGTKRTPVNWSEMLLESLAIIILAVWIVTMTARHLRQIKYLEGFLSMCSFCKKIRVGDKWVPLEQYIGDRTDAVFTHGFCPECGKRFYGDYGVDDEPDQPPLDE